MLDSTVFPTFNVPCFFSPRNIAERRRVILKCVVVDCVVEAPASDCKGDAAAVLSDQLVRKSIKAVLLRHDSIAAISTLLL